MIGHVPDLPVLAIPLSLPSLLASQEDLVLAQAPQSYAPALADAARDVPLGRAPLDDLGQVLRRTLQERSRLAGRLLSVCERRGVVIDGRSWCCDQSRRQIGQGEGDVGRQGGLRRRQRRRKEHRQDVVKVGEMMVGLAACIRWDERLGMALLGLTKLGLTLAGLRHPSSAEPSALC